MCEEIVVRLRLLVSAALGGDRDVGPGALHPRHRVIAEVADFAPRDMIATIE